MNRALPSFIISLFFAFLVIVSGSIRDVFYKGLTLTLYVPLLKVEASLGEIARIGKERDELIRENLHLLRNLSGCFMARVDTLWNPGIKGKPVRVLSFDPIGIPWRFYIEGGKKDGFAYGDPVIRRSHLVGKIFQVNSATSIVLTLFNPSLRVGVVDLRTGVLGVLEGGSPPSINYVPVDANIRVGDTLITSGLGGIFPRGILVGVVSKIHKNKKGEGEMFLSIEGDPFFDFSLLGKVEVLK